MTPHQVISGCACCSMNRRHFLQGCAASAVGLLGAPGLALAADPAAKMKLRIIYSLHAPKQPGPDWPNKGFDFNPIMERNNQELAKRCKGFEFLTAMATGPEQAQKILEEDKTTGVAGYVIFQMNCWNQVIQTIAASGKPVLYSDFQFGGSGGFLVYTAGFLRKQTPNVGFVASSRFRDVVEAVKCFQIVQKGGTPAEFAAATAQVRKHNTAKSGKFSFKADSLTTLAPQECLARMRASKILAFRDQTTSPAAPMFEIPVEGLSFAELNDAWKAANPEEAHAVADRWQKTAAKVEGVSSETLHQSAAMYLGMKALLKKHNATGITVNCLGGFYGGHIHAYPCLGFHELNNEGLVGGCECDVRSAVTMSAFGALAQGRPGYISDPVIDTAKHQIIYAHCVASNKVFGPAGPTNPFEILTHSEDRQGASIRSILPVGYLTTTVEIDPSRKQILFHQAKAVANDPDDRACRTKLCGEPIGDIEKLFTQWDQWGWHRVTFYGDLKQPVFALADLIGWKVIEEA